MSVATAPGLIELDDATARATAAAFDINRLDRGYFENPYPVYHALRRFDPVHRNPDGTWFVSRYDDALVCYRDRRMSSDKKIEFRPRMGDGPLYLHHTTSLVFNDPPLHTRVRKLLAAAFTPRAIAAMEPRIDALVDRLLDEAADKRRIDLIADFASPLPLEVVCTMLGVPPEEREPLRAWATTILSGLEPMLSPQMLDGGNRAVADFSAYLDRLIERRRKRPADDADVLGTLIHGEVDGEKLTHAELVQNCIFLLNAGHETTTNLVGNGVDALVRFPDEMERLRHDPGLIESAIEEMLRFESSNQLGNRRVTEEIGLGGVTLPAGAYIWIGIGAANRDPAQFPEPDRFDVGRTPNRHLAFATGIHACLGMSLARLEGRIAIGKLLARFPKLRRDGDFVRGGRARFRGFASYPMAVA
jgi:cytochrome P450